MPFKRKSEAIHEPDHENRRLTRSSAASIRVVGQATPQRKRRRAPSSKSEIENSRTLQSPKVKRKYGRNAIQLSDVPNRRDASVESETDDLKLTRAIVAVEIPTPRKTKSLEASNQQLLFNSVLSTKPSRSSPAKTVPSHPAEPPQVKETSVPDVNEKLPAVLPARLHDCLEKQKYAILDTFHAPPFDSGVLDEAAGSSINFTTAQQLTDLLSGSIERGEGNSCLIVGPAGSGKSRILEESLGRFDEDYRPIVVRLDGHVQNSDHLAIREIARQIIEQTGSKIFESIDLEDDENPFDNRKDSGLVGALPPPSHLPSLIAALPSLPRPVVVVLDAFNIFTEQPRQALLYCLLDTVQSCRAGSPTRRGLAVIGLTSRIDVVNFLEKRVKSRFSHRILRAANIAKAEDWSALLRKCLCTDIGRLEDSATSDWSRIWERSVQAFLEDRSMKTSLSDMFGISRDIRRLFQAMAGVVIRLTPNSPYLSPKQFKQILDQHLNMPMSAPLMGLNYPSLSLCIAAQHARTAGHDSFNFEMLYDLFSTQVRTSSAAPVMVGGGRIGMINIGRRVLMSSFEELIQMKVFLPVAPSNSSVRKEFIKYRCMVERDEVKAAVGRVGQTNLKKWFSKAQ